VSDWIEARPDGGVLLRLQIQPKASRTEVVGPHGEPPRLKVRVAAPPVEGAANDVLVRFLAKKLGVPRSAVAILRGEAGKLKDVVCLNIAIENATARLLE
jgi:uncharacterized protein (TIGR00251 family)